MAYDRTEMSRKVAQVEKDLTVDGKPALVKDIVAEVVKRGICGSGVAYQVVAHLRKAKEETAKEAEEASACTQSPPKDVAELVAEIDRVHEAVDRAKVLIVQRVADHVEGIGATLGALLSEQTVLHNRSAQLSQNEIDVMHTRIDELEAALATARSQLASTDVDLMQALDARSELESQISVLEVAQRTSLDRAARLEDDLAIRNGELQDLRRDLEAVRTDLQRAREEEAALREELRMQKKNEIGKDQHSELKAKYEAVLSSLSRERQQNADLHKQLMRLVQTAVGQKERAEPA